MLPQLLSAGDLGIEIDFGANEPGAILQRKEGDDWQDYLEDGELVTNPFDVEMLEPVYSLRPLHPASGRIIQTVIPLPLTPGPRRGFLLG